MENTELTGVAQTELDTAADAQPREEIRIKRVIQRCGCDKILPLCFVYIFYIILHGHLSPAAAFRAAYSPLRWCCLYTSATAIRRQSGYFPPISCGRLRVWRLSSMWCWP